MFTILLSILCSTLVYAAPQLTHTTTVPWNTLKDDTTLSRFQSTLLNQTLVTFLNECYSPELLSEQLNILCPRYFDAILQLNSTDFIVSQPAVNKLLNEPNTDEGFCRQKHTFPAMKYYTTIPNDFSEQGACGYLCMHLSGTALVPRQICVFLAWLGDEMKNLTAVQLSNVPENAPNSNNSIQQLTKTETNPVKPNIPIASNNPSVPIIQSQKNDNASGNIQTPNATEKLINKKPESDVAQQKEETVDHKLNVAIAEETAAEIIAPTLKEEKQKPPLETIPPLDGTEKANEDDLSKIGANVDKPEFSGNNPQVNDEQPNDDSEDENQDEGPEEDDDHNIFQKPIQLHNTDKLEPQQKSVETVEDNIMPMVPKVKDPFYEESGSNFFTYFLFGMFLCIVMYVVYHNKSKILALLLEGRRSDKGRGGRRKHTAAYRKLDSNLEEAITSSASGRITQIIY